jgi:hypothetical protein
MHEFPRDLFEMIVEKEMQGGNRMGSVCTGKLRIFLMAELLSAAFGITNNKALQNRASVRWDFYCLF